MRSPTRRPVGTAPRQPPRRILIVDDHGFYANGLTSLINNETDIEVCRVCSRLGEVAAAVEKDSPDLVILDVSIAGESSIETGNALLSRQPGLKLMFISSYPGGLVRGQMHGSGAGLVVEKTQDPLSILRAVRRALES